MRFALPRSHRKFVKFGIGGTLVLAVVGGTGVEALSQSGGGSRAYASVASAAALPAANVAARPHAVTVVADGKKRTATTTQATVSQLLSQLRIGLGATDTVRPATGTALDHVSSVVVTRIRYAKQVRNVRVPKATKHRRSAKLAVGKHKVLRRGHAGVRRATYQLTYVNGKLTRRTTVASKVLRRPQSRIVAVGTRPLGINASPAEAKAIAKTMLKARGWSSQYSCLSKMWTRESGWNLHAHNSAGAYGIPQALPGAKLAAAGADWRNNARTQIAWGLRYIAGRYGTPCRAWAKWQTQSWY